MFCILLSYVLLRVKFCDVIITVSWSKGSTVFCLRVKNDHRSKFSNLSNWKEEA